MKKRTGKKRGRTGLCGICAVLCLCLTGCTSGKVRETEESLFSEDARVQETAGSLETVPAIETQPETAARAEETAQPDMTSQPETAELTEESEPSAEANSSAAGGEQENSATEAVGSAQENPYAVCTSKSKEEVEEFAARAKECVLKEDWEAVSGMVSYPITIQNVTYPDAESLAAADITLTEAYRGSLEQASCTDLFANWEGIMIGNGEIWFAELLDEEGNSLGLFITAIQDGNH